MKKLIVFVLCLCLMAQPVSVNAKDVKTIRLSRFLKTTMLDKETWKACKKWGSKYKVSPFLIASVIETESGGDCKASCGGCLGLMQVSAYWNRDRMKKLKVDNLYDKSGNVKVGTHLLSELIRKYGKGKALVCYNMGESGASKVKYLTRYAKKILKREKEIKRSYNKIYSVKCKTFIRKLKQNKRFILEVKEPKKIALTSF